MGRKYYHKCTECGSQTYYDTGDKEMNGLKVTNGSMSVNEKRRIYHSRYVAKKKSSVQNANTENNQSQSE